MEQPLVVLFVGIPGSGKTAFARELSKKLQAVLLNSDAIRIAMWRSLDEVHAAHATAESRRLNNQLAFGAMNYATEQTLKAGYSVVYDCNANHRAERQEKHDVVTKYDGLSVVVRLRVPYELALRRVQDREDTHDQRRFDLGKANSVLERFTNEIEEPTPDEHVIEIAGDIPFEEQYKQFMQKLEEFRG